MFSPPTWRCTRSLPGSLLLIKTMCMPLQHTRGVHCQAVLCCFKTLIRTQLKVLVRQCSATECPLAQPKGDCSARYSSSSSLQRIPQEGIPAPMRACLCYHSNQILDLHVVSRMSVLCIADGSPRGLVPPVAPENCPPMKVARLHVASHSQFQGIATGICKRLSVSR